MTDELMRKLHRNIDDYLSGLCRLSPNELINRAEEIYSTQLVYNLILSEEHDPGLLACLEQFQNPLEVLRDRWIEVNGGAMAHDDDMRNILWAIKASPGMELRYATEQAAPCQQFGM